MLHATAVDCSGFLLVVDDVDPAGEGRGGVGAAGAEVAVLVAEVVEADGCPVVGWREIGRREGFVVGGDCFGSEVGDMAQRPQSR